MYSSFTSDYVCITLVYVHAYVFHDLSFIHSIIGLPLHEHVHLL